MEIHERVKILRRDKRLSQIDFGLKLGVSRAVINNFERGALTNPNSYMPLIKLMSYVFNVSEEWLLRGESPKPEYKPGADGGLSALFLRSGATAYELALIRSYLELDYLQRAALIQSLRTVVEKANSAIYNEREDEAVQ